jgi:dTDP-4-amino-4,6-dideoxygalactose transaminase
MSTATAKAAAAAPERLFLSPPCMSGLEQKYVAEAFASNYVAPVGPMLTAFEQDLCTATGFKHAVGVSCGTAAIHLILRVLGIKAGDRVFASNLTFIGSIAPILYQQAVPVFIDNNPGELTMSPELLAKALAEADKAGKLPKAILPSDLYGQSCDLDAIIEIAGRYDIPVICDAAESLGARYKDRHAGKGAVAAALSFNGNKIITASGGGAVVTDDAKLAERITYYTTQAREPVPHYEHVDFGYNYRLSNIMAAIGRGQLATLPDRVAQRQKVYARYRLALSDLPGVSWIDDPAYSRSTQWLSLMVIDPAKATTDREKLRLHLESHNIESRAAWKPMHLQPVFKGYACYGGEVSAQLFEQGLCLPSGHALSEQQQDHVIELIRRQLA